MNHYLSVSKIVAATKSVCVTAGSTGTPPDVMAGKYVGNVVTVKVGSDVIVGSMLKVNPTKGPFTVVVMPGITDVMSEYVVLLGPPNNAA